MPELIEVETYRRQADAVVGRRIRAVVALDPLALGDVPPEAVRAQLEGVTVTGTRRIGKLLLLDTDGPVLGLRFGMTGRLLVDGTASIEELEYGADRDDPAWDRTVLAFDPDGELRVRDPRRLGKVVLDPDETRLGPDAATITAAELAAALDGARTALKARLLDQGRIAGLGNLLVDETCFRAGIDPGRQAGALDGDTVAQLAGVIRETIADLTARGGSHTGDLQPSRAVGGLCPRDGTELERRTIGGRTTWSCPHHQR